MSRTLRIIAIFAVFLLACDDPSLNNSNDVEKITDATDGVKLRKITQNHSQYGLYHRDAGSNIIRYEFYHGLPGREQRTIYADYSYESNRLAKVEQYVFFNNQFEKTQIEEYEYDELGRLNRIKYRGRSEIDFGWSEGLQEFYYNDRDQLIKMVIPGNRMSLYYYAPNGNVRKEEIYPLFEVEYEGPLTTTYTFDNKKNPFYHHDTRPLLPLANGNAASMLNPNNIVGWETYSPTTGEVISRSSIVYEYTSEDYPASALEKVISPLTEPQPNVESLFTEYEYVQE